MERRGPTRPKFGTVCALLGVSGMMAVFVLAGSAGSASSPAFSAIKVCANSAIWVGGCATNERNSTLRSSTLTCSFTIAANAANVTAFWRYNGVPGFTRKFAPDPRATIGSIAFDTGGEQPIPGGIYTCVVRAGTAQGSATIKSSGPMGAIVQAAACSGDHASRIGPARLFPLCPNDESARPVAGGRAGSVVCNAVYPSAVGQTATTELLRDGTPIGHTSFKVTETLTQGVLERPSDVNPTPLQPGNYGCRFTLSGGETVTKSFSLVPGKPSPSQAASQVLRELSELHVRSFNTICVPHKLLQLFADPDPGFVVLGSARIRGKAMILDDKYICAPLVAHAAAEPTTHITPPTLLALSVVAHEYGHTLGLRRENIAECFAARAVWKWVRRSNLTPSDRAKAHTFILDNRRRPAAYKLTPTCTLPS